MDGNISIGLIGTAVLPSLSDLLFRQERRSYGTNVASLTPSITVSTGATISPASGATRNFSSPVTYTVSNGGVSQTWTVTVTTASAPPQGDSDSVLHQGRPVYYNGRIVRIG